MSSSAISKNSSKERTLKYRWVIWSVIVLSYAIKFFHSLSMGVIKDTMIMEFGISETTFVSIGNVFFYIYLLMQIPTGILVDTYGARLIASLGTLFAAIGITIFSFATSLPFLYIGRGLVGLGTAVVFVSILKIQSTWFRESEFGTMTGITCFIGVMGGALAQTPLAILVSSIGWRSAFRLIGIASFIVAIAIAIVVRNKPEDMGMVALNKNISSEKTDKNSNIFKGLLNVLKNPQTWPLFLMYAGFYGTYVIMMGYYGTSFISSVYNKTTVEASKYIIAGIFGSAIGSIVVGNVSDRIKSRRKPLILTGGLYVLTWGYLVFFNKGMPPENILIPLIFLIGFTSCAYVISWPTVKEVNNPKYVGVSTSVANIGGFFGTIVLPPIVASIFVKYGETVSSVVLYQKAFTVVLGATIIGFLASLFVKETGCKNIYNQHHKGGNLND